MYHKRSICIRGTSFLHYTLLIYSSIVKKIKLSSQVYNRDANWVYHAEDYEGMDCSCACRWNASVYQNCFPLPHYQSALKLIWGTVKETMAFLRDCGLMHEEKLLVLFVKKSCPVRSRKDQLTFKKDFHVYIICIWLLLTVHLQTLRCNKSLILW